MSAECMLLVATLTHATCPRVCLARQTDDAATTDGRYLRKGSECRRASSHRYCSRHEYMTWSTGMNHLPVSNEPPPSINHNRVKTVAPQWH